MSNQPARPSPAESTPIVSAQPAPPERRQPEANEMACPVCGSSMPDLKGGKATICPTCGFKDSCCF